MSHPTASYSSLLVRSLRRDAQGMSCWCVLSSQLPQAVVGQLVYTRNGQCRSHSLGETIQTGPAWEELGETWGTWLWGHKSGHSLHLSKPQFPYLETWGDLARCHQIREQTACETWAPNRPWHPARFSEGRGVFLLSADWVLNSSNKQLREGRKNLKDTLGGKWNQTRRRLWGTCIPGRIYSHLIGKRCVSPSALGSAGPLQSLKSQTARTEIFMCVLSGLWTPSSKAHRASEKIWVTKARPCRVSRIKGEVITGRSIGLAGEPR